MKKTKKEKRMWGFFVMVLVNRVLSTLVFSVSTCLGLSWESMIQKRKLREADCMWICFASCELRLVSVLVFVWINQIKSWSTDYFKLKDKSPPKKISVMLGLTARRFAMRTSAPRAALRQSALWPIQQSPSRIVEWVGLLATSFSEIIFFGKFEEKNVWAG